MFGFRCARITEVALEPLSIICMSGGNDGNGRPAQAPSTRTFFDDEEDYVDENQWQL